MLKNNNKLINKNKGVLFPRPYARLLSMIGDQLIKNEKVALTELIKNSYDADANWVQIRFMDFRIDEFDNNILVPEKQSLIEIEDDGNGMIFNDIEDSWLNPAAPQKYIEKKRGNDITKYKKRIIQGEKGIGRFAVYKLGSTVELITRSVDPNEPEIYLINDLSKFDQELIVEKNTNKTNVYGANQQYKKPIFLDQIEFLYEKRIQPVEIKKKHIIIQNKKRERLPHGTLLRISNLKSVWSYEKIKDILEDIAKLTKERSNVDFICDVLINNESQYIEEKSIDELELLKQRAPIRVKNGSFDGSNISFSLNGKKNFISLQRLKENKEFRNRFLVKKDNELLLKRKPECGPFNFEFYIFDLTSQAPAKYKLNSNVEKPIIRKHRIYLYRDGIRVYPFGDKSDDWLQIDILRGIGRAGDYLSNDQTYGVIEISSKGNPTLRDKTNREGLLEIGNAFEDFRVVIQGILGYLQKEYKKYKLETKSKDKIIALKESITESQIRSYRAYLEEKIDKNGLKAYNIIAKNYIGEKEYLLDKLEIVEDLAAVGIAVEMASHDMLLIIGKAIDTLDYLINMVYSKEFEVDKLKNLLLKLEGQINFIDNQISGIQPIFRSSKREPRLHKVFQIIKSVIRYYGVPKNKNISIKFEKVGENLLVKCAEAILLQCFINLLDNSLYWLSTIDNTDKKIFIRVDCDNKEVVFADNGPGIKEDDIIFIFEPFFSTKGIGARGLGLYITRQLLSRYDFNIEFIHDKRKQLLPGANFSILF